MSKSPEDTSMTCGACNVPCKHCHCHHVVFFFESSFGQLPLSSSPFLFRSGLRSDLPVAVLKCWCGQKELLVFAPEPVRVVLWLLREGHVFMEFAFFRTNTQPPVFFDVPKLGADVCIDLTVAVCWLFQ